MAKEKHFGRCALCGKERILSFEHIPPHSAFNTVPVKLYPPEEIIGHDDKLPWDLEGRKFSKQQRGAGTYSLCESCNNLTGAWYGNEYRNMAHTIAKALTELDRTKPCAIELSNVYPLRFVKQILSLFCSVNNYDIVNAYKVPNADFAKNIDQYPEMLQSMIRAQLDLNLAAQAVEELRTFVLDKSATGLDEKKFKLCMYFYEGHLQQHDAISCKACLTKTKLVENTILSEITAYPFGFILYFFPSENIEYDGIDITSLSKFQYDDCITFQIPVILLERNTPFPGDYRSKDEIQQCIDDNSDVPE